VHYLIIYQKAPISLRVVSPRRLVCLVHSSDVKPPGHYARKIYHPQNHRPQLMRASDLSKDQTYYLSSIAESSLDKALFPLANISKTQVREIAHAADLHNASREESMGLCFVGERRHFNDFLGRFLPQMFAGDLVETNPWFCGTLVGAYVAPQPGPILEIDTKVQLGKHNGLWTYTIGQGAKLPGLSRKLFVAGKDHQKNAIYVALPESVVVPSVLPSPVLTLIFVCARSHPALFTSTITSNNFSWIWRDSPPSSAFLHEGFRASVKIRNRMTTVPVTVRQYRSGNAVQIIFYEPHKAVAQGQIAVLYDGDYCLGCGTVDETTSTADLRGSR